MSKIYTSQKTGLTVVSGRVKAISEDAKTITVNVQQYVKAEDGTGHNEPVDITLVAPVPVEGLNVNDLVTATGFKAGAGKVNIETINHENAYVEKEGFGIISGEVLFANRNDEIDRETGETRLTKAGTPKKPHFDITVAVGEGQNRVTHTVKIYNVKEQDNIGRYEKLFANFDREKNPVYVSMVTRVDNANSYIRESTDKQGRVWKNQCMSHMGINSLDATFVNGREMNASKETEAPKQEATAPVQQPIPMPQPQNNGFSYNLDDLDTEDLDMAQ